jgi:hypothetical protein
MYSELHARWFSGDIAKWWAKQTAVNVELEVASHSLSVSKPHTVLVLLMLTLKAKFPMVSL